MKVKIYKGQEIEPLIPALAQLRIKVFRDYPYLYEGSMAYEENYLKIYPQTQRSVLVAVFDAQGDLVGASTGMPLSDEADYVQKPFLEAGYDIHKIFYFAESVLENGFRGMGLGHRFFEGRESAAKEWGYTMAAFCAVERPENHPAKPLDYHPLDEFWDKKGFKKHPKLKSEFSWPDLGDREDSTKKMVYWLKDI